LYEYATVLQMLLNNGIRGTNQVLSTNAISEMQRDQTVGTVYLCSPYADAGLYNARYGIGEWRDFTNESGAVVQVSSIGAFGFTPWIDLERRVAGVFMVVDHLTNVSTGINNIQTAVRQAVDVTPCTQPAQLEIAAGGNQTNWLTLNGARGHSYSIEASTNLAAWSFMQDLPGTNGWWELALPATNGTQQFYRSKQLP
jgi:hypothetical protein